MIANATPAFVFFTIALLRAACISPATCCMAPRTFAWRRYPTRFGRPTAAITAMRATTTSGSISEKPRSGAGRESALVLSFMAPPLLAIGVPAVAMGPELNGIQYVMVDRTGPLAPAVAPGAIPSVTLMPGTDRLPGRWGALTGRPPGGGR